MKYESLAEAKESLEYLQTAVFELDDSALIQNLNSAAQAMLGSSNINILGQPLDSWFIADETLARLTEHILTHKKDICRGVLVLSRVSDELHSNDLIHVILTPLSAIYMLECYQLGIYDSNNHEAQWGAQLKNHQILIKQMAHEIKNPLGGIRGAAQLLHAELSEVQPNLMEYTEMILTQVDRLRALVDQFLIPYKRESIQPKLLNIHEICESVHQLTLLEFSNAVEWVRDYDVSIPEIHGVADYLQQLLLNLLQNAAQAVSYKDNQMGKVTIRTRIAHRCMVNHQLHNMMLELSVIDNGIGVPANIYDTLFLPMVSGRESGTGLGLSIAMQIAQQHGGTIELNSRSGYTQMRVLLPLTS